MGGPLRGGRPYPQRRRPAPVFARPGRRRGASAGGRRLGARRRGRGASRRRGRLPAQATRAPDPGLDDPPPPGHECPGASRRATFEHSLIERLPTGNEKLDEILKGGLLKNAINLIVGIPGSGKTILSQQFAFHNATQDHPSLFLSTLSDPLDKILRYAEALKFFDAEAVRDGRIVYEDLGQILGEQGLDDVISAIDRFLKEVRPGVVVIDSFRAFHALAKDETTFRQFLFELTRRLTASATTSLWNAPYSREEAVQEAEFAVADAIIALDIKRVIERELRVLQVMKLRGSSFLSGEHVYRITDSGLTVFPRLADMQIQSRYELSTARAGSGIAALDELLGHGDGYWQGATTLVAGPSGIGKTLMGLHFLYRGAQGGEHGGLATFQENDSQLSRDVSSFGWTVEGERVHYT